MDSLNLNAKLNHIKIKNKCVHTLKYYLIHSYDSEIIFLLQTLKILKLKYPQHSNFIEQNIEIIFTNLTERIDGISSKIENLVDCINKHNYYELYEDIITTLYVL
jgi:hypothetical protein